MENPKEHRDRHSGTQRDTAERDGSRGDGSSGNTSRGETSRHGEAPRYGGVSSRGAAHHDAARHGPTHRTSLRPSAPFELRHTLDRLAGFRACPIDRTIRPDGATLALAVEGLPLLVTLREGSDTDAKPLDRKPGGRGANHEATDRATVSGVAADQTIAERATPELLVTLESDTEFSAPTLSAALDRLRFQLGLDDDLTGLYRSGGDDPAFAPVLSALHGFHPVRHSTPFEAAVWALVQQRTPNSFAFETMRRLTELLGPAIERGGVRYRAFPEPHAFLGDRAALLTATNNTRKVERLVPLAEAFARADEIFLRTAPYDEVASWLRAVHGVGRWSSDYVLLRGLGRHERTPWSDTGLLAAISRVYTGGFAISRGDAREIAERYGWDQGLWAHYLKIFAFSHATNY